MTTETAPAAAPAAAPAGPARPAVPPFARRTVGLVAGVVGVVQLALAVPAGRWFDEALMVAIGRHHLDWGSADQPPVAPLLARLADVVAPDVGWVLRLPAVLAAAGAVLLAAAIARELGGDARAQTLTALAQATGVWTTLVGHWLTPYSLEPVEWLALGWLLVRWVRRRDDRLLLWFGVVLGIAAETKFQVMLLAVGLLATVAVFGPRDLLRRPRLWVGAGIGAALAAPTLVWQAGHGWPQLAMGPVVAGEAQALYGGRPGIAVEMVLLAGVLGVALGGYGLWRLLAAPELRELRFLGVATVVLFVLVVATAGRPYYTTGLYGLLAAVGAVGLQRRRESGHVRARWVAWPAGVLAVGVAAVTPVVSSAMASPVLPERVAAATAAAYRALPPDRQAHTALVGESYVYATYLDAYSRRDGLPPASSTNRSYGYFTPPPERDDQALYVGADPGPLRGAFATATPVGAVDGRDVAGLADPDPSTTVWLLTGRHEPWAAMWPRLRHLDMS